MGGGGREVCTSEIEYFEIDARHWINSEDPPADLQVPGSCCNVLRVVLFKRDICHGTKGLHRASLATRC